MFIYDLSIFLTSTAFVDTNAKIRHTYFEICRIFENCPLGYSPNRVAFLFGCGDNASKRCGAGFAFPAKLLQSPRFYAIMSVANAIHSYLEKSNEGMDTIISERRWEYEKSAYWSFDRFFTICIWRL